MKITHIINPVKVNKNSDLYTAQPITFESMRIAEKIAKDNGIDVKLLSAQYTEDVGVIPNFFEQTPNLQRSVLDLYDFTNERKLPLLKDILEKACDSESDYIIYTNADIALMPHFYLFIKESVKKHDAFCINRRTINKKYSNKEQLPLMYSEIGEVHPGFDCFVFKKNMHEKFNLGNVCVGAPHVGQSMILNMVYNSDSFKEYNNKHLTFHIGNDRIWKNKENLEYKKNNFRELEKIIKKQNTKKINNVLYQNIIKNFKGDLKKRILKRIKTFIN